MLLDMLTADTPAKHGHAHAHDHDYSPPRRLPSPPNPKNGAYSLAQMPLALLGSVLRYQTPSPSATPAPAPALSAGTASQHAPNASPMVAPAHPAPRNSHSSRPGSSGSAAAGAKPKKRAARPKTSYMLAHPPPQVHHPRAKLHIRPKVQLQLHQVLAAERPRPVYEVIPFTLLAPRSTRRLARAFNTRERLGLNDLLVVKAAAYGHTDDEHKSDDERWGSREVVAVICPGKMDRGQVVSHTEICMDDGTSRWEVTHMPNGGYEFNSVDEHGLALKARWVAKPPASRRTSSQSVPDPLLPGQLPKDDSKWNFSTISPTSRRHPVIATMTRTRIDVHDSYTMPAVTQPSTPDAHTSVSPSPALTPASIDAASFLDAKSGSLIKTEEALRRFILVSGIWVSSLHENYELATSPLTHLFNSSGCLRPAMARTVSMSFLDSPRSASPVSTDENEKSIPKLLRHTSQRLNRHSSFTDAPASPMSAKVVPSSPAIKTRSRRANTTGTHNLYSLSGSMKKRYGIPSQVETLSETEEDKEDKRSGEFLKQLEHATPVEVTPNKSSTTEAPARPPALVIPTTNVIRPSTDGMTSPMLLPSPQLPDSDRTRKTQSAYNPITTAGMWDSGVTDGPGLKRRPTSMFVMNERKKKEEKKRGRSEGRGKKQESEKPDRSTSKEDLKKGSKDKDCTSIKRKLKNSLKGMFGRKEKI
ncbi:hypothetical protein C7974DRAFT_170086 [Boeremia exigua]|uniref:uncharacterized protein n=1 Tax=Boeremia exigua TaxID=749465 RepID=UPI001E8D8138|nr:uncharacterized protein C7974DRAFT_170086 [Boeremia exigua]KAH6633361.1 hypothetical protein C7974DRAFT_170086 [Boeremia exigua]